MLRFRPHSMFSALLETARFSLGSPSYYPANQRKGKLAIVVDNLVWRAKHHELNSFYFAYGMDRASGPAIHDVLPYKEFRRLRDERNRAHIAGQKGIDILQSKVSFEAHAHAQGLPTPRTLALVDRGIVHWINSQDEETPLASLYGGDLDAFCKPASGIMGGGAFRLTVRDERILIGWIASNDQSGLPGQTLDVAKKWILPIALHVSASDLIRTALSGWPAEPQLANRRGCREVEHAGCRTGHGAACGRIGTVVN